MRKTVLFILLVILLSFGLICCATQANNGSAPVQPEPASIRYDGVYYCRKSNYTSYIRFYENGTVITVSSIGTIAQIKNWFNKDHDDISRGEFNIIIDKLSFSSTDSFGTVDYNGQILNNMLLLNSYSHINGNVSNNVEYLFSTW